MKTEEEFRELYLLSGIATGPATPKQVDAVESAVRHPLPAAYRAYLRVCGLRPPESLVGSHCVIRDLPQIQEEAIEILAEDKATALVPEPFLVFSMHQGYFFDFFPLNHSDDPPVYAYQEFHPEVMEVDERFSLWVLAHSSYKWLP
jgi:hypothetical protein